MEEENKTIWDELNIFRECKRYNIKLWQCPQFLFLVMGALIVITAVVSYLIGTKYLVDPRIVALIVLTITVFLFVLAFIIIHSFEKLAQANRIKSEFVGIVSHQLRSPLSNLKWISSLLLNDEISKEESIEYVSLVKENTERMMNLVSDLLVVSKIQQGKIPFDKRKISLKKITEDTIETLNSLAKASNVKINLEVKGDLPKVKTDPGRIKEVIDNLLTNAIKYSNGGGKVDVTLSKEGKKVRFKVKDRGIGIPEEDQKNIFKKFFRCKNALKYQTQGTGLGLFIAKSVIEEAGGKIKFKSEKGEGSTFWFTLPIEK